MKKLLLILLCLIVVTGCGNEVEQQPNKPNIKQEEVETNKYITIKIKVNEDCSTKKDNSCKVEKFTVENDKDNIFKDLDLNGLSYCDMYGNYCYSDIKDVSALNKIYDIAIKNNLNYIPDYRYLVDGTNDVNREIVLKPLEEFKWKDKINLNENVLVKITTGNYLEYEARCMYEDKEYGGKSKVGTWCDREQGGLKRKISSDLPDQINKTPGRTYKSTFVDDLGYEEIMMSDIKLFGNPMLYKESSYNLLDNQRISYKKLYNDYLVDLGYNTFNIDVGMDKDTAQRTTYEYKMLDEKLCEEYKLACDRW